MKRALPWILGVVILTAVLAVGLSQAGSKTDEKAAELAKKQRELAEEAAKNTVLPEKSTQQDLQKRQAELAREVEKLQTPEAATAQA